MFRIIGDSSVQSEISKKFIKSKRFVNLLESCIQDTTISMIFLVVLNKNKLYQHFGWQKISCYIISYFDILVKIYIVEEILLTV